MADHKARPDHKDDRGQVQNAQHHDNNEQKDFNVQEEKKRGANQYTEGRNDDRGRKE